MDFFLVRGVGAEISGTAGATAPLNFTTGSNYFANQKRQAVIIASCGAATLYVKISPIGGAPTVTSGNFHIAIPAGTSALIRCTRDVDLYLFGTTAYTAEELR